MNLSPVLKRVSTQEVFRASFLFKSTCEKETAETKSIEIKAVKKKSFLNKSFK